VVAVLALAWALSWFGGARAAASQDAFDRALAKGEALLEARDYPAAIKALRKAERAADEPSARVLMGLAQAHAGGRDIDTASRYARNAMAAAGSPVERARAQNLLGLILLHDPSADPDTIAGAEAAFRGALELTQGQANDVRYNLAEAVERQGRPDEARTLLAEYLAGLPEAERATRGAQVRQRITCLERLDPSAPPIRVGGDVTRPERVFGDMPRMSEAARQRGVQGLVILEATIDRRGEVTAVELLEPLDEELDRAAIEAIRTWRFTPATYDGCAVPVVYNLTTSFRLQ
jgi:TonB family protein